MADQDFPTPAPDGRARPLDERDRKERTAELLVAARGSDGSARRRVEDRVVMLNLPVAREVARRYRGREIDSDDLEQVALLGLVKAVRGYRPDRGSDFLSYAVPTIRGELRRYFRDHGWMVRPPRPVQELQGLLPAAEEELMAELGRRPTAGEVAERLDVDVDSLVEARAARGCFVPQSLDAPRHPQGTASLAEQLSREEPAFDTAEARAMLAPLLRRLSARERRIVFLRFAKGWTQAEIGAEIGVTQMQVSRLLSGILSRLREELTRAA